MTYNPEKHHRRSIRLRDYDYSQPGAYFITLCTQNRECLFGDIVNGEMVLNEYGMVVKQCWLAIPQHFPHAQLDAYVIMPNHVHGIIILNENVGVQNFEPQRNEPQRNEPQRNEPQRNEPQRNEPQRNEPQRNEPQRNEPQRNEPQRNEYQRNEYQKIIPKSIGSIVRGFKIGVTKWFRENTDIYNVWQRNYYEHIVRNEYGLTKIREYIINNPLNWENDENYR